MSNITVYSKPSCQQCKMTKKHLTKIGKNFKEIDVSVDDNAKDYLISLGYMQMPVVKMEDGTMFTGFKPALLEK